MVDDSGASVWVYLLTPVLSASSAATLPVKGTCQTLFGGLWLNLFVRINGLHL